MNDQALIERLDYLEAVLPVPSFVGISFVAKKFGVSVSYLRSRAYLLPSFGVSEIPGKRLWSLRTVREWVSVAPIERERAWFALPLKTRVALAREGGWS